MSEEVEEKEWKPQGIQITDRKLWKRFLRMKKFKDLGKYESHGETLGRLIDEVKSLRKEKTRLEGVVSHKQRQLIILKDRLERAGEEEKAKKEGLCPVL